jgi:serine/threonine-protein kinase RsbW
MSDDFLRAISHDDDHYALTKALGFTSYITVPLVAGSDVFGAVNLISAGSGRRFGTADVTMAEDLAAQVAQVVAKARRYEDEHRLAHTLQASLLPARLPAVPGLSIAVRYLASTQGADVGGDWYDVLAFPDGAADLTVGDVAGHDIGAAAAMGQMRSAARAMAGRSTGPGALIERLHNSWTNMGLDRMATLVVARLEPASGHLVVASAGHPPPMVLSDGRARFLPITPGAPLGAPVVAADEWSEVLAPGDILLLYTDGLVEARRTGVDEGMEKLAAAAESAEPTPDEVADTVLAALGADREDDVALLAVARA